MAEAAAFRQEYGSTPSLKPLISANWKMNKNISETIEFIAKFRPLVSDVHEVDIVLCPPFTSLPHAATDLEGSNIYLGAQNMFSENGGAFTGEVSPLMLKELGCTHVILGHSERREYFFEPDFMVNKKVRKALQSGIFPILCIGETLQERDEGAARDVLTAELEGSLEGIGASDMPNIIIAYEPVWAIGTGKTATPEQAQEMHSFIRSWIAQKYGRTTAGRVRIIYGGSMNEGNVKALMAQPDINGGLIGGASLDPEKLAKMVKFSQN